MNTLKQPQQSDTQRITIHNGKTSNNNTKAYIRKQRACGIALLIIAILSAVISQDGTAAVILVPMAFAMLVSKKLLMNFRINWI